MLKESGNAPVPRCSSQARLSESVGQLVGKWKHLNHRDEGRPPAHSLGGFGFSPAGSTSGARMRMTTNILSACGSYRKQRHGWS